MSRISECSGCSYDKMRVYLDIFAELDGAHCVSFGQVIMLLSICRVFT